MTPEDSSVSDGDHIQEDMEEDVNDKLNDTEVHMNTKSNETITRKKEQLVAQDYAQIKWVDFDEAFTPIDHLEAIIMFLGLSCSLMFTHYQMDVKSSFLNGYLNVEVNQDVSNDVIGMGSVIENDDYVEVCQDRNTDVNNIKNVIMIVLIFVDDNLFRIMSSTMLDHLVQ